METVRTPATLQQLELGFVKKVLRLPSEKKHALAEGYLQILARLSPSQAAAILNPNGDEVDQSQASEQLGHFFLNHRFVDPPKPGTARYDDWEARQRKFNKHVRQLIPGLKESDLSQLTTFSTVATEEFVGIIAPDNPLLQERAAGAFRWIEGAYKIGI